MGQFTTAMHGWYTQARQTLSGITPAAPSGDTVKTCLTAVAGVGAAAFLLTGLSKFFQTTGSAVSAMPNLTGALLLGGAYWKRAEICAYVDDWMAARTTPPAPPVVVDPPITVTDPVVDVPAQTTTNTTAPASDLPPAYVPPQAQTSSSPAHSSNALAQPQNNKPEEGGWSAGLVGLIVAILTLSVILGAVGIYFCAKKK